MEINFSTTEWNNADDLVATFTDWDKTQPDRDYEKCAQTGWGWNNDVDDDDYKRGWHDVNCDYSRGITGYTCRFERASCP